MVTSSKSRPLRSPVWDYFKVHCKLCTPPAATTLAYHGGLYYYTHIDQLFDIRSLKQAIIRIAKSLFVSALVLIRIYVQNALCLISKCMHGFTLLIESLVEHNS